MNQSLESNDETAVVRPGIALLILKLLALEFIVVVLYSVVKIPQIVFSAELGELQQTANIISWFTIFLFSMGEMVFVVIATLSWVNDYYLIRQGSIIHRSGVFKLKEEEFSLRNIEALTLEQNFWQRLFNYGTIHFYSPVLKQDYYLMNINKPQLYRDLIDRKFSVNKVKENEKIIFRR